MHPELIQVGEEIQRVTPYTIHVDSLGPPSRWEPNGLVCPKVPVDAPVSFRCHKLQPGSGLEDIWPIASEQDALNPNVVVRHAWPLDLFRAFLASKQGWQLLPAFNEPDARIIAFGSGYLAPEDHEYLEAGYYVLTLRTAEKVPIFLEAAAHEETWRPEMGRNDYVLLVESDMQAPPSPPMPTQAPPQPAPAPGVGSEAPAPPAAPAAEAQAPNLLQKLRGHFTK